jgi:hypothetical protein
LGSNDTSTRAEVDVSHQLIRDWAQSAAAHDWLQPGTHRCHEIHDFGVANQVWWILRPNFCRSSAQIATN